MVATLLLAASIFAFYAALGHLTTFERLESIKEPPPAKAK